MREKKKNRTSGKSIVENWLWVAIGVYITTTVILMFFNLMKFVVNESSTLKLENNKFY